MFSSDVKETLANRSLTVVSPDTGGVVRARAIAKRVDADLAIIDKRREQAGVSEVMNSKWLRVGPETAYWVPRLAAKIWNLDTIYITENGTSGIDQLAPDGNVHDLDRIMYLRNYLAQLQRATAEGVPVRGYFLWSLIDNFEWSFGFEKRFGLYRVDFKTQLRTPKLSASFYRNVIARNAVDA